MTRFTRRSAGTILTLCFIVSATVASACARADTGESGKADGLTSTADTGALHEVVVTAQRRSEAINRVGLSVSALTSSTLEKQGIESVADLANALPGLSYTLSNQSTPVYTLRGVGFYENLLRCEVRPLRGHRVVRVCQWSCISWTDRASGFKSRTCGRLAVQLYAP